MSLFLVLSATTHKNRLEVKVEFGSVRFHLKEQFQEDIQKVCGCLHEEMQQLKLEKSLCLQEAQGCP